MVTYKDIVERFRTFLLNITKDEDKYMSHHVHEILCHQLQSLDEDLKHVEK